MLAIILCPQCRAPVAITQRSWLHATDGPHPAPADQLPEQALAHPASRDCRPAVACHPSTTSRHCQADRSRRGRRFPPAPQVSRTVGGRADVPAL
jgi:hypothetical protein